MPKDDERRQLVIALEIMTDVIIVGAFLGAGLMVVVPFAFPARFGIGDVVEWLFLGGLIGVMVGVLAAVLGSLVAFKRAFAGAPGSPYWQALGAGAISATLVTLLALLVLSALL